MRSSLKLFAFLAAGFAASCSGSKSSVSAPDSGAPHPGDIGDAGELTPGQTDFTTEQTGSGPGQTFGAANGVAAPMVAGGSASTDTSAAAAPAAPSGRDATVQEADIYRIDNDRLFYFNTYRGLLIYDLTDPKNPKQLSRLPVYGYPIEMFVAGNTVYALLSDALYLTEVNGKLQFDRHYVSQLVAIDVTDLTNPQVLSTVDIIGELREGVSRKIDNTIYLVSYISQSYYWGWGYEASSNPQPEQAWVYSFDVSDPKVLKQVGQLQIFQGGSVQVSDPKGLYYYSKTFSDVTISATSNALMVDENWWVYGYSSTGSTNNGYYNCGSSSSQQQSVVSIIDVSDPNGTISLYTRFEAAGQIGDQFKMTYVFDTTKQTGTFYGIFARQGWTDSNCMGNSYTQNTFESWDITNANNPTLQASLDFGNQNETVAGSTFDVTRNVAYAVTSQRIDPLYALSFADPKNLKILSAVDGLSGNMDVFQLIGDNNNFLLGIGQDNSSTCTGPQDPNSFESTNIAVSIVDVRDLTNIRLVQRQCVAVQNAEWVSSDITWNLDQAHKMIGMYSDSTANVVTVPVYYWTKSDPNDDWWWQQFKSAVGIMAWDLTKYDDTKDPTQQTVLQNYGTFIHPNGEVRRTIVFGHQATGQRMMVNLSDTYASIANIQDLANPQLQSTIEIAPYYNQTFQFGNYLVAQVQSQPSYYYSANQDLSQFRVLAAGGDLDGATPVASFSVGQVQQAMKHGNQLLLFRYLPYDSSTAYNYYYQQQTQVLVYDLTDPTHPQRGGSLILPSSVIPYYPYWCGWDGYWGGYWFNGYGNWTEVESGLVTLNQGYVYDSTNNTSTYTAGLVYLDLTNANAPAFQQVTLPVSTTDWYGYSLVSDPVDPTGFYLSLGEPVGQSTDNNNYTFTQYKYYAQRWNKSGSSFVAAEKINVPGPLVRTWAPAPGSRNFMTQDQLYVYIPPATTDGYGYYRPDTRLHLLNQVNVGGKPAAELLDTKVFSNIYLAGLTVDGNTMYVTGEQNYWGWGYGMVEGPGGGVVANSGGTSTPDWTTTSDRLMIYDLSNDTFAALYDQPTKAYNLQIMGAKQGRLFLNLSGDGILAVDVSNPAQPTGVQFLRTLGWANTMQAFGNDLYVASGYFGLNHMSLTAPASMPVN
ncbi:MAG: beta-propeller domain-containing protein [Polyangia bacterium]